MNVHIKTHFRKSSQTQSYRKVNLKMTSHGFKVPDTHGLYPIPYSFGYVHCYRAGIVVFSEVPVKINYYFGKTNKSINRGFKISWSVYD